MGRGLPTQDHCHDFSRLPAERVLTVYTLIAILGSAAREMKQMTSRRISKAQAERRLRDLGFKFDWSVTDKSTYGWNGTIDAIGKTSIGGDCRGIVVAGDTASEMYAEAIREAETASKWLEPCPDPDNCDLHSDADEFAA